MRGSFEIRRIAIVLGVLAALLCGCGGSGGAASPTTVAVAASVDAGREVSVLVRATEGGVVRIADGAMLTIPPGALAEDTTITANVPTTQTAAGPALRYKFGPSGTRFRVKATLVIPYENLPGGEAPSITVYQSSTVTPLVRSGAGELTNWDQPEVLARDFERRTVTVAIEHFSFVYAFLGIDRDLYLVTDIPSKYLQPGDVCFTLTRFDDTFASGPNWRPGHVGVFCGNGTNPVKDPDRIIEAGGNNGPDGAVAEGKLNEFKRELKHLYLGPRRLGRGGRLRERSPLTPAEQARLVSFLEAQLGKPYSTIGAGVTSQGAWSCVGLAEGAMRSIGRPQLDLWSKATAATPIELFWATHPVDEIEAEVGEEVSINVYVAIVSHRSPLIARTLRGWYVKDEPYTMSILSLPPGAQFPGNAPPAGNGYRLEWTPGPEHAGKTFTCDWEVRANTVNGFAFERRRLEIRVRPARPATPSQAPSGSSFAPVAPSVPGMTLCPKCAPLPCACPTGGR